MQKTNETVLEKLERAVYCMQKLGYSREGAIERVIFDLEEKGMPEFANLVRNNIQIGVSAD